MVSIEYETNRHRLRLIPNEICSVSDRIQIRSHWAWIASSIKPNRLGSNLLRIALGFDRTRSGLKSDSIGSDSDEHRLGLSTNNIGFGSDRINIESGLAWIESAIKPNRVGSDLQRNCFRSDPIRSRSTSARSRCEYNKFRLGPNPN